MHYVTQKENDIETQTVREKQKEQERNTERVREKYRE